MKFLLKQLRLFFPFVFPMYDIDEFGYTSPIIRLTLENRDLKKEMEELKARVQALENKNEAETKRHIKGSKQSLYDCSVRRWQ